MAIEINTVVSVGETFGKNKVPPITLEDAKFFGRPNFAGVEDDFKDTRRKFTVLIPNEVADHLRDLGYNVKTKIPTQKELEEFPDREMISHLKVMIDLNLSDIFIKMGDEFEKLNANTMGVLDRARIVEMSMELRAWEYNPEEKPGEYSARLVSLVAVIQRNRLSEKYGIPL